VANQFSTPSKSIFDFAIKFEHSIRKNPPPTGKEGELTAWEQELTTKEQELTAWNQELTGKGRVIKA
jgi:hypothetical protein